MSRIDELITELCPDGVEFKALGDIAQIVRGNGMPKAVLTDKGVGAIHYGQIYTHYGVWATETLSFVSAETAVKLAKVAPGDIIITNTSENIDDVGKALAWLGVETIVTGGHATVIKHDQEPKYLAYWFASKDFSVQKRKLATGTKVIDVSAKQLAIVRIPVPPLEVQREIVRILDEFTQLEAELEAELEARKKQYVYYRDQLLSFQTVDADTRISSLSPSEVRWATLEEVFDLRQGYTPRKSDELAWISQDVPWFRMEDIRKKGGVLWGALQGVSNSAVKGKGLFPEDSFLVATSATVGVHAWVRVPHLSNQRFTNLALKSGYAETFELRFLYYYLFKLDEWCLRNSNVSSFASVDMAAFRRFPIPIIPTDEQRWIASSLEKFDALVNDLSSGLPAEISARRKQYEYYRDKLLTFKEATA
ncbi:restriction endonuclease subunit S [Corynebacterium kutscheri]|uniref:restriction endonuclease subunit S n=1 Tax=Corynebacterium kutscheri TaxID=35755 RepID=UPI0037BF037D